MSVKQAFGVSTIATAWSAMWFELGLILIGTKGLSMLVQTLIG